MSLQVLGDEVRDDLAARLWPGLAGIAGLLLLLPQPVFRGLRWPLALLLMPLLTSFGAVFAVSPARLEQPAHRSIPRCEIAGALLLASILFALLEAVRRQTNTTMEAQFSFTASTLDGSLVLLSLIALRTLGATRWAAQFLLAPLITLTEGVVLLRPVLDMRSWLAFALLAISSIYLLLVGGSKAPENLSLTA